MDRCRCRANVSIQDGKGLVFVKGLYQLVYGTLPIDPGGEVKKIQRTREDRQP